ncbi:choline transporter-like protein 1 isoform X2 [Chironomus tepperi]|uniref:choline transporter-like protein 1 isoform X2 n=1 Tax=Chironomus tepperi TaxID=113505 RepID=UPI00391FB266
MYRHWGHNSLAYSFAYCVIFSNLSILTKGRDGCGNICGELNDANVYDQCGPHDMRNHPKLLIQRNIDKSWIIDYKCVDECPLNSTDNLIQCWENGNFLKHPNHLSSYGKKLNDFMRYMMTFRTGIGVYCAFTFLFSCILLILLRFMSQAIIWVIPILLTFLLFLVSVIRVLAAFDSSADGIETSLFYYVGFFVILMCVCFKKVVLIAAIYSETAKVMMNIPWIIIVPIMTFIILTILIPAFLFASLLIETSGTFSLNTSDDGQFQLNSDDTIIMKVVRFLNILTFAWLANFIIHCQHFIVAGSVTKWYFTGDKHGLAGLNGSSMFNLVRYHLGSVCFGSMAVPVMGLIHFGYRVFKCIKTALTCCCNSQQSQNDGQMFDPDDRIFGMYSRCAYILIDSHGTAFLDSGKKSYDLMFTNIGDVYWLKQLRDILLLLNQVFVPFVGIFAGILVIDSKSNELTGISPAVVDFTFTFLIAHCFFMSFGMTIDTILLNFCIDWTENDGDTKPYYMSDELKSIALKIRKNCGYKVTLRENDETVDEGMLD